MLWDVLYKESSLICMHLSHPTPPDFASSFFKGSSNKKRSPDFSLFLFFFLDPNCIPRATATTRKRTTKTTTKPWSTTKATTEKGRTSKTSQSIILSTTASPVTPQKTTATTQASRFSTSQLRLSVVTRTTEQDTQGPVARASSDDQIVEHQKNLIEAGEYHRISIYTQVNSAFREL